MPRLSAKRLRKVRTLDDVLEFLAEGLDWPIDARDLEDASFDYEPSELGIPDDQVPHFVSLRELRPLTASQPWGVFFIEFAGHRLPVTPLRRLLRALVVKKRAQPGHRTWKLDDLLFVITTDTGDAVELHIVAFFDTGDPSPEIRSLPWRPEQSPERHLRRLATELLPSLEWPDDEGEVTAWRRRWREAFKLRHGEPITSAARLSERMADVAVELYNEIVDALEQEAGRGPFNDLLEEVRTQLVADVDEERFADMCAQTLVYGALTSRVTDPEAFGASPTLAGIPFSNPFLNGFFEQVHDLTVEFDPEEAGLDQLVADLQETNVEAILDEFGSTAKGGDPVIHFYEEFLKRYDPKMRADAGAFYTPQPVVRFMVRTVDELLKTRFGLPMGIADPATWADVADRLGCAVPDGVDPDARFVTMVDPATGTGTFLVEWIRQAERSFRAVEPHGDWPAHLREVVLPSMHAFELMLAPYAIAHLKLALELDDHGVEDVTSTIVLTDTLDHPAAARRLPGMEDPLALEGEHAAALKEAIHFSVCIGNPPYDREQKTLDEPGGKRKGGVVRYGVPGIAPLLEDVTGPMREAGLGKHVKNLYNDYVYFWRWATWQVTERPPAPGVVAFITASSYLDGVSMGGLRAHLRHAFDELWIVDLGGEGRGAHTEENVFDIRTPVAVAFGVRVRPDRSPESPCEVRYLRVRGDRAEKFAGLSGLDLVTAPTEHVVGRGLEPFTPRSDSDYRRWPEITDLMPTIFPGLKAGRTWVIGPSPAVLTHRLRTLLRADPRERGVLFKDSPTGRKVADRLVSSTMPGEWDDEPIVSMRPSRLPGIAPYGYRSFDRQYVIEDPRFLDRASAGWAVRGPRQVFFTTLTSTKLGAGPALTVTPYVPDLDYFSGRGAKNVMPLYRDRLGHHPNVTHGLLAVLAEALGQHVSAEDLAAYLHGLLGTGAFTERFAEALAEAPGPVRVPLTADAGLFRRVCELGRDLLWWHTWGDRFAPDGHRHLPAGAAAVLEPVRGYPERFDYDGATRRLTVGTGVFGPVSEDAWGFEVSGLRVLPSWLGYRMAERKGKKSSPLDDIRPSRWTFTDELLTLIAILEHTVEVTPQAAALLEQVVNGPLIDPAMLPVPTEAERKPPRP